MLLIYWLSEYSDFFSVESHIKDANGRIIYRIFAFYLPTFLAGIIALYPLYFLRKRKKRTDYPSALNLREKFFLLLPLWWFIFLLVWGRVFRPFIANAQIPWENEGYPCLPISACEAGLTYEILDSIFFYLWIVSFLLVFAPWFSYLDYWRRKKEAAQKASESRSS